MDKNSFINEVKKSEYMFSEFDSIYKEFNYYQDEAYKTLLEFHSVCEKNNVTYELAFGSLLGIVRDKGQIPWDYDIDVIVPYNEKEKLLTALNNDLNNSYYYYSIENNNNCRHMIMRLAPKGFKTESLHVDVFFAIGTPEDEKDRILFSQRVNFLSNVRFYKKVKVFDYSNGNMKTIIKILINKFRYSSKSINKIMKEYYYLCSKYSINNSTYVTTADTFSGKSFFISKDIMNTKKIVDESGNELRIPVNYDNVLKMEFGDYNKIFPLESRLKEMMSHYNNLHKKNGHLYLAYKKEEK